VEGEGKGRGGDGGGRSFMCGGAGIRGVRYGVRAGARWRRSRGTGPVPTDGRCPNRQRPSRGARGQCGRLLEQGR
jgi:hypothetical protein